MAGNVGNISKSLWNFGIPCGVVIRGRWESPHKTSHSFSVTEFSLLERP